MSNFFKSKFNLAVSAYLVLVALAYLPPYLLSNILTSSANVALIECGIPAPMSRDYGFVDCDFWNYGNTSILLSLLGIFVVSFFRRNFYFPPIILAIVLLALYFVGYI